MTRTQIQIPDVLYDQAKRLAEAREISLAELVRRGLEYMLSVSAPAQPGKDSWDLPAPLRLGSDDPFAVPDWRYRLHMGEGMVAEPQAEYRIAKNPRGRNRT